jgi:hypothetical protein
MKKHALFAGLSVAATCSFLFVARGDAPSDQYELFQQTTPTITDNCTGLEWERFPEQSLLDGGAQPVMFDFDAARQRCQKDGGGWRLPTVKELLTIVDEDPHKVYHDGGERQLYVDRNAFPTTAADDYWTSSPAPKGAGVFSVNFGNGRVSTSTDLSKPRYVRCVRSLPPKDAGCK